MGLSNFKSTSNKKIIRQQWNAPLLSFLKDTFTKKLIYFGLPSPNAEDIFDWIDYIDFIVAFQCRDYPNPSDPSQSDTAIRKLETNLNNLMRKKLIENYDLYDGYIEEVLINGKDNDNTPFKLERFITIYNLDFCNEITIPQVIFNATKGIEEQIYKLHVLKKIIDIQNHNNNQPYKFVAFLTVKASFWKEEEKNFEEEMNSDEKLAKYLTKISTLKGIEKSIRILKAYVFITLSRMFCVNNYIPEFLPIVRYKNGYHDLVQFTIIGTYKETVGRNANQKQDINSFLNQGFLTPNEKDNALEPTSTKGIVEDIPNIDSVKSFCDTIVYEENWK